MSAVERDSGDYECQLTGDHTDHVDEDLVLNQKLEINVFDKEKSLTEGDESSGRFKGGREKTSKAESVLASFVQNDQLQQAEEEKGGRRRARQERKSDERQATFQRSSGSRLRLSSLGPFVALLCSVTSVL